MMSWYCKSIWDGQIAHRSTANSFCSCSVSHAGCEAKSSYRPCHGAKRGRLLSGRNCAYEQQQGCTEYLQRQSPLQMRCHILLGRIKDSQLIQQLEKLLYSSSKEAELHNVKERKAERSWVTEDQKNKGLIIQEDQKSYHELSHESLNFVSNASSICSTATGGRESYVSPVHSLQLPGHPSRCLNMCAEKKFKVPFQPLPVQEAGVHALLHLFCPKLSFAV